MQTITEARMKSGNMTANPSICCLDHDLWPLISFCFLHNPCTVIPSLNLFKCIHVNLLLLQVAMGCVTTTTHHVPVHIDCVKSNFKPLSALPATPPCRGAQSHYVRATHKNIFFFISGLVILLFKLKLTLALLVCYIIFLYYCLITKKEGVHGGLILENAN